MILRDYFKIAIDRHASDLHLVAGALPSLRIDGKLEAIAGEEVIDNAFMINELKQVISEELWKKFDAKRELDFSHEFFGKRFRINLHYQRDQVALTTRLISEMSPDPDWLGFNDTIYNLANLRDGLVLVTGPSGSGKSTTLAAMINIINKSRGSHIITIEDPIEYVFENDKSLIEQREIGTDTLSFADALKYSLRQDPNIIMVGEMRDLETMAAALTAAETGHLVLSTLHTASAADSISRIVDSFPPHQQAQVLNQLSTCLKAIITQQLIPRSTGGLVAAREILINNAAVASLIRRNQVTQIMSIIQTSAREGMIPMNKAIDQLTERGIVSYETSEGRKRNMETQAAYY
ncbi:MAG: PilT/PilU family type 4a pilus ATPase [Candidatus Falkowbacteria bacterium]|nr:PilT/PilU family type 4a pilus ATPase [Candidatus Falkowbacteria bacterium]